MNTDQTIRFNANFGDNRFGINQRSEESRKAKESFKDWEEQHPNWQEMEIFPPAPPLPPNIPPDYWQLTRHLTSKQWKVITLLSTDKKEKIETFAWKLNLGNWESILPSDMRNTGFIKQWCLALQAYELNLISIEQFATCGLICDLVEQCIVNPMLCFSLKEGNVINKSIVPLEVASPWSYERRIKTITAQKIFDFKGTAPLIPETLLYMIPFLGSNNDFIDKVLRRMNDETIPVSEKTLFVVPILDVNMSTYSPLLQRVLRAFNRLIPKEIADNLFKPIKIIEDDYRARYQVLPSFTMIQNIMRELVGEDCVNLVPVLGTLEERDIERFHMNDEHPLDLNVPGTGFIQVADGLPTCGPLNFDWHDIYHAIRLSLVPKQQRYAVLRIISILRRIDSENARKLANKLIDGELHNSLFANEKFSRLFNHYYQDLWNEQILQAIKEDFQQNPEFWRDEVKVSIETIFNPPEADKESSSEKTSEKV